MTDPHPTKKGDTVEELIKVLQLTRMLVARCAVSGFTDKDALVELYENNSTIARALSKLSPLVGFES